jgi:hypothetical protein
MKESINDNLINEINPSINEIENKNKTIKVKELGSDIFDTISLSTKSKFILIIRILVISLICIFFPMETIVDIKLELIEKKVLLKKVISSLEFISILKNETFIQNSYYIFQLLSSKDTIIIYISIIYFLFHPFIALKLVFITDIIYYGIIILQILFKSKRPFWKIKSNLFFCETNYGNPSNHYFLFSFFILYLIISFRLVDEKQKSLNIYIKLIIFLIYLFIVFFQGIIYLINHIYYAYQLFFTLCISLVLICILIDLDSIIHNFIYKTLKNVYKSRQYKMKILFYVLGMVISAVLMLYFIQDDNLNLIKDNLKESGKCSSLNLDYLGIKKSFLNIGNVFCIVGAFWGTSLTLEKKIDKWWNDKVILSLLKVLLAILLNFVFIFFNDLFTSLTFEIIFIINCFNYFLRGYLIFGFLPFFFERYIMNKSNNEKNEYANLFKNTIFFEDKKEKINEIILMDYNEKLISKKEDNKKKKQLSSLVDDVKKHSNEDGLEFTLEEKNDINNINESLPNFPLFKEDDEIQN